MQGIGFSGIILKHFSVTSFCLANSPLFMHYNNIANQWNQLLSYSR